MESAAPPWALAALIFVLAGWVKGVTGMGLPTVAMALLVSQMPPVSAAALLIVPSLVTNAWQMSDGPALGILMRRLWPMLLVMALTTLAAAGLMSHVPPALALSALGLTLMVYSVIALCAPALRVLPAAERAWGLFVGGTTGLVTGTTGVFVMPAAPYLQALSLPKNELVQALGLSFTVSTCALGAGIFVRGEVTEAQWGASCLALGPALLGVWCGRRHRQWLPPKLFRVVFLGSLLLLGTEMSTRWLR